MSSQSFLRKLLIVPPLLIGAGVLWFAMSSRQPPDQRTIGERAQAVRVITVKPIDVAPKLVGYGSVRPENIWTGIAQVSGRIVYMHPQFKRGALLEKGTVILRISPDDYKLAIAESEAQIRSSEAALAEMDVTEKNTKDLLGIEQQSLKLKEETVEAKRALLKRGNVAKLNFDAEVRDLLKQKKSVQDLRNSLRLIPTQRAVKREQIRVNKAKLATAKLNLKRTVIALPFAARISSADVQISQFVQVGAKLGVADAIGTAEITAQYPIVHLRAFFDTLRGALAIKGRKWSDRRAFLREVGLYSIVRLRAGDRDTTWRGEFSRLNDSLDEQTRTVGLITRVVGPYTRARTGGRPPLLKGMFVEVELRANTLKDQIVVPVSALHNGAVYLATDKSRLLLRKVTVGYQGAGFAVLTEGLKAGDRVIVSDVPSVANGLLLKTTEDKSLSAELAKRVAAPGGER